MDVAFTKHCYKTYIGSEMFTGGGRRGDVSPPLKFSVRGMSKKNLRRKKKRREKIKKRREKSRKVAKLFHIGSKQMGKTEDFSRG